MRIAQVTLSTDGTHFTVQYLENGQVVGQAQQIESAVLGMLVRHWLELGIVLTIGSASQT